MITRSADRCISDSLSLYFRLRCTLCVVPLALEKCSLQIRSVSGCDHGFLYVDWCHFYTADRRSVSMIPLTRHSSRAQYTDHKSIIDSVLCDVLRFANVNNNNFSFDCDGVTHRIYIYIYIYICINCGNTFTFFFFYKCFVLNYE